MKKLAITIALVAVASASFAQGRVNFGNSSTTLISAGGTSTAGSGTAQYNFAIFLAPSTTAASDNLAAPAFNDPIWQTDGGYTVNHATAAGRLVTTATSVVMPAPFAGGTTADFIVRGWSANAGATWAQALASWNNGAPENAALAGLGGMYIGQSEVGNNIVFGDGGALPTPVLFGVAGSQVNGFNMAFVPLVPEPSSMALAGLGAASLLLFRRRK